MSLVGNPPTSVGRGVPSDPLLASVVMLFFCLLSTMEATHCFCNKCTGSGNVGPFPVTPSRTNKSKVLSLRGNSPKRKTENRRSPVGLRHATLHINGLYTGTGSVG